MQKKNGVQNVGKAYLTDRKCAEFTEYISKSIKSKLADDLASCNYYSCLNDGSTDSSVTEEVVLVLFLKEGTPALKYSSTEPVKIADASRIVQSITYSGACVNLGKHRGVGKLVQEKATWLLVIHCFNH